MESSSPRYAHWKTYKDAQLGIRIDYPSDEYTAKPIDAFSVEPYESTIDFQGKTIVIEGLSIGDRAPEGNGIQLYRTRDAHILDYLQQYKPFTGKKTVNGIVFQQFEFVGMGDVYGYVTQHDDRYFVFESMWGPNNPVSEKMLQSLFFEKK